MRSKGTNQSYRELLDFSELAPEDAVKVRAAIDREENFFGYIPDQGLRFILRNYRLLAAAEILEAPWLDAYVHTSNFENIGLPTIKAVFDACNRSRLRELKPLGDTNFVGYEWSYHTLQRPCWSNSHDGDVLDTLA